MMVLALTSYSNYSSVCVKNNLLLANDILGPH